MSTEPHKKNKQFEQEMFPALRQIDMLLFALMGREGGTGWHGCSIKSNDAFRCGVKGLM